MSAVQNKPAFHSPCHGRKATDYCAILMAGRSDPKVIGKDGAG